MPRPLVSDRFQDLFHSPPGVLFSVRSRYYPLSVYQEYLALEGGPPIFTPGFTGLALLWIPRHMYIASHTGLSPPTGGLSSPFWSPSTCLYKVLNPGRQASRFGLIRVRSPLLTESRLISSPPATEMFQFAGFASPFRDTAGSPRWVAPFGHPGINGPMHLPQAYRSLARPSSPLIAELSSGHP